MQTWQRHREQLVGWFPRYVTTAGAPGSLEYHNHQRTLSWDQRYNVALTKGAIMHRRYLEAYTKTVPTDLLDLVAKGRNCEDILMQYVVSSQTADAPVFVWDMKCASLCCPLAVLLREAVAVVPCLWYPAVGGPHRGMAALYVRGGDEASAPCGRPGSATTPAVLVPLERRLC